MRILRRDSSSSDRLRLGSALPSAAPLGEGSSRSLLDLLLAGRLVLRRELDLKAFELLLKLGYGVMRSTLLVAEVAGITVFADLGGRSRCWSLFDR